MQATHIHSKYKAMHILKQPQKHTHTHTQFPASPRSQLQAINRALRPPHFLRRLRLRFRRRQVRLQSRLQVPERARNNPPKIGRPRRQGFRREGRSRYRHV